MKVVVDGTIDCNGANNSPDNDGVLWFVDHGAIGVQRGFTVTGSGRIINPTNNGVRVDDASDVLLEGFTIETNDPTVLMVGQGWFVRGRNEQIENCRAKWVTVRDGRGSGGLFRNCAAPQIKNCTARNLAQNASSFRSGFTMSGGASGEDFAEMVGNIVEGMGALGHGLSVATQKARIEGNLVWSVGRFGLNTGGGIERTHVTDNTFGLCGDSGARFVAGTFLAFESNWMYHVNQNDGSGEAFVSFAGGHDHAVCRWNHFFGDSTLASKTAGVEFDSHGNGTGGEIVGNRAHDLSGTFINLEDPRGSLRIAFNSIVGGVGDMGIFLELVGMASSVGGEIAYNRFEGGGGKIVRLESAGLDSWRVHHNVVPDPSSWNGITDSGTNTIWEKNRGMAVTENRGTATIPSGSTSIAVTHDLEFAPSLQDLYVTPHGDLGAATNFWISNPTATQFTINLDVDPGVNVTFGWIKV
jgi:hypothetical protein